MDKKIDGKLVSSLIKEEVKEEVSKINDKIKLAVIQVGNNEASNIYVGKKVKLCEEIGIDSLLLKYDDISPEELISKIEELNHDDSVNGILVQLPLPNGFDTKRVVNTISYLKDVDGLTDVNIGRLYNKEDCIVPCTALGVIKLMEHYDVDLEGKKAAIVGRSSLVGIPLFKLLLDRNCTVLMCHSKTKDLEEELKNCDIVVSATGVKHLIKKEMIKDDAVVVDVGITRVDGKLYGDVDYDNIYDKASLITPVPGGVGPMTVACLMENTVNCYKLQRKLKK